MIVAPLEMYSVHSPYRHHIKDDIVEYVLPGCNVTSWYLRGCTHCFHFVVFFTLGNLFYAPFNSLSVYLAYQWQFVVGGCTPTPVEGDINVHGLPL